MNNTLPVIETAQICDIPSIKRVIVSTWYDTYREFLSERIIKSITSEWHTAETLKAEIDRASTFMGIAKQDQQVIAVITAHQNKAVLYVSRLYVLASYQRRGIGQRLLNASYRALPETQSVQLEVLEQNLIGRTFYRKLGFQEVDRKSDNVMGTVLHSIVMQGDIKR